MAAAPERPRPAVPRCGPAGWPSASTTCSAAHQGREGRAAAPVPPASRGWAGAVPHRHRGAARRRLARRATVFPQAVGLGATWDRDCCAGWARPSATEVRGLPPHSDPRGSLNVWAPVVNLLRDPRWGRNEEGYTEDPLSPPPGHRLLPRAARRPPALLAHRPGAQALPRLQQRDRPLHHRRPSLRPGYCTSTNCPASAGRRGRGGRRVMPAYNLVNGRPSHVSTHLREHLRSWDRTATSCLSCQRRGGTVQPGRRRALLRRPRARHARGAAGRCRQLHRPRRGPAVTVRRITEALERGLVYRGRHRRGGGPAAALRLRLGEFDPRLTRTPRPAPR